ncbi:ABC transporter permease [Corynebacterium sp. CCUG 71335]|uniref:ABC transporter permease n=1 Tax=unclassified Corynebacterium TaxID=2624378 RepID=UPI002108D03B|nr:MULTISPECIES: ABC transporter permease [unclassified Corynebacterium]MCQ4618398.1 ABC transporter permease [Corynebacterium pseudogenitalium]MCQ4621091.1 ABC transporter permease [Corynebacterium sp. CCUG 71335]MCQ4623170.1 ABC transporter permease [Corynebacterium sp. CCUG 70398]MCQ4625480.1 ABC transporter permease [Corynebacterium sp. CCUG 69979]
MKQIGLALLRFVLMLFAASVIIFVLLRAVPGDPARIALGVTATDEDVAALAAQLGTDRPLVVQYFDWIGSLLTGDFGVSLSSQQEITPLVWDRVQVSLILTVSAMVLSLLIAIPLGTLLARRNSAMLGALTQIGIAVPSFLAGILAIAVFSVWLGWLPANGWSPPNAGFGKFLSHLVLPVVSLTLVQAAILTRYVRSAVAEEMDKDYVRTARSIGLSTREALYRHALKNALLPVLTVAGLQMSTLIVGAVVIERVFVIPGVGSMLLDAVATRDLTTVQTIMMLLVVFTLAVTLLVDLLYRLVDPRLRRQA